LTKLVPDESMFMIDTDGCTVASV